VKPIPLLPAAVIFSISAAPVIAQVLTPAPISEVDIPVARNGAPETLRVSRQSWAIPGQNHQPIAIPLPGFYIAHLISGHMLATIGDKTTEHLPGDFWSVPSGSSLQVKVLGEAAVLETTAFAKQQ
jgi:quercetin dioxygenase-like cupin family protein